MLRRFIARHGWWHWQNLDEARTTGEHERYGERRLKGKGWRHGRAWFNLRGPEDRHNGSIGISWSLFRKQIYLLSLDFEVDPGGDDAIGGSLYLFPFAFWWQIDGHRANRLARFLVRDGWDEREISVRIVAPNRFGGMGDGWTILWRLWSSHSSWSSRTPKWRDGHWNVFDSTLGRHRHSKIELSKTDVLIPMPERPYPATVTMFESTWRRQRFPFIRKSIRRAEVEIDGGIPFPGKGENAWDCGDDAVFSSTFPATTVEEAIGKVVSSVMRDRRKNGGSYTFEPSGMAAD